jgi:hypothetical protein
MGTRGLLFIRWKGRYYIYYNHWDSYPEGLGKAIVEKIPATPKEYQGQYAQRSHVSVRDVDFSFKRMATEYATNLHPPISPI